LDFMLTLQLKVCKVLGCKTLKIVDSYF